MKLVKKISAVLLTFVMAINLSACSATGTAARLVQHLAVLVGIHGNSYAPNFSNETLAGQMTETAESYGNVTVIGVDGKPETLAQVSLDINDEYKKASATKLKNDAATKARNVLAQLSQITANDPEVDTLGALIMASNSLSDAPAGVKKVICVLDTGLSTTGMLDFGNNLLYADADSVVAALEAEKAIPNLEDTEVYFFNLGQVAPPQEPLSYAQQDKLESIWRAIVEAGGGKAIVSKAPGSSEILGEGLPAVSTVSIEAASPIAFDRNTLDTADTAAFQEPTFLTEEQVQFIPDSDEYLDSAAAEAVLDPIAQYLQENQSLNLLLVGTTAGEGINDFTLWLSQARADTVKRSLTQRGVAEDRLVTLGLGAADPWHVSCPLESDLSAANRKVVLIDLRAEIAQSLIT